MLVALFSVLPGLLSLRLSTAAHLLGLPGRRRGFSGVAQLAFLRGQVIATAVPLAALAIATVCALAVAARARGLRAPAHARPVRALRARGGRRRGARTRGDGDLRLGGVSREGTVLFCDLRGFTSFAESLPPDRVIEVLNHYLTRDERRDPRPRRDADRLHGRRHHGRVRRADRAARPRRPRARRRREMLARLPRFNAWLRARGHRASGFRMGIGINSGPRDVRQRRLRAAGGVHGDRRHHQHGRADRGHDEGHAVPAVRRRVTVSGRAEVPEDLVFVDEMAVRGRTPGCAAGARRGRAGDQAAEAGSAAAMSISVDSVASESRRAPRPSPASASEHPRRCTSSTSSECIGSWWNTSSRPARRAARRPARPTPRSAPSRGGRGYSLVRVLGVVDQQRRRRARGRGRRSTRPRASSSGVPSAGSWSGM